MKKLLKNTLNCTLVNLPILLFFDMAYKIFSYSILYSINSDLMSLILKTSGIPYITAENVKYLLLNPISIFLCICIIVITGLSVYFEMVALYVYCEFGWNNQHISIITFIKETFIHCKKLFSVGNIIFFLIFTFTSLLTMIPFSPYNLQRFEIPEFLMDFIKNNNTLFAIFIVISILANIFCILFIFFFPNALFSSKSIKSSWKNGFKVLKISGFRVIFDAIKLALVFCFFIILIISLIVFGLVIYSVFRGNSDNTITSFTTYFYRTLPVVVFVVNILATIWLFSISITLFHKFENFNSYLVEKNSKSIKFHRIKKVFIFLIVVISVLMFSESELGGIFVYDAQYKPQIVAHRSGILSTPENTMSALNHSISRKIDMVEIDVQELKDGTLILSHDDNFNRISGINKNTWEVGYNEVKNYDAGSWFSDKFKGEKFPKLDEFLKRSKGNIKVMIELKYTGYEKNLVPQVISLIEKYDMTKQCSIGSLNLNILKEVKKINPKIETVYITPLIFSGNYNIGFVDAFSVETSAMTREMVASMKLNSKKVYGWTANSESTIKKNLRCHVDGIVTDNPELVRQFAAQTWDKLLLDMLTETFFGS